MPELVGAHHFNGASGWAWPATWPLRQRSGALGVLNPAFVTNGIKEYIPDHCGDDVVARQFLQ